MVRLLRLVNARVPDAAQRAETRDVRGAHRKRLRNTCVDVSYQTRVRVVHGRPPDGECFVGDVSLRCHGVVIFGQCFKDSKGVFTKNWTVVVSHTLRSIAAGENDVYAWTNEVIMAL